MKKIKNYQLFTLFLILGFAFYLPTAFVKADNEEQNNISGNQVNVEDGDKEDIEDNNENDLEENDEVDVEDNDKEDVEDNEDDDDQFKDGEYVDNVTSIIQNLLNVANKEKKEVSKKIKEIADEQDNDKEDVADKIDKIQQRSKIKTFLIGTDYKNVGQLRSDMVKVSNQIDQLNSLLNKTTNTENKTILQGQIQILEQQQNKIGDLLKANESKFSLFGWFVKLFSE